MSLILTLDSGGNPNCWSTWQDAVTYKAKGLVAWEAGEVEFTFTGGKSRATGELSRVTVPSIIGLKGKFKFKHRTPSLTNKNLFRRDLLLCAYCGNEFHDNMLTRDHIIPRSRGGVDTWMNCVTACKSCNNRKDDRLLTECHMQLLYVPYIPDRAENLILMNRRILADQMDFLRSYLPKHSRALQLYTGKH